jgi:hypothetical protein
MNRCVITIGIVLQFLFAGNAFSQFSDDFSDPSTSNTNWVKSAENLVLEFNEENQYCHITNGDTTYVAFAYHSLAESEKSSTFTISGRITLDGQNMGAGFICCLSITTMATGYYIALRDDRYVVVTAIDETGSGAVIFTGSSAFVTSGTNILKISKKDSVFNVFCNNRFVGTFTDDSYSSGDIALLVGTETGAIFDDVVLNDTFEEGTFPTCFSDDFNDGNLVGWDHFGSTDATVEVEDEALHITTEAGQGVYQVFNLPLQEFIMQATVSYKSGGTQSLYGLFISGEGETSVPFAGFGISGGKYYGVFLSGVEYTLLSHSAIKGAPYISSSSGDTTFYTDTLQVVKREGEAEYLFIVNADTITKFTNVTFPVTGAGIFCSESLDVVFDDFIVAEGTELVCPIRKPLTLHQPFNRVIPARAIDAYLFDCSGRILSRRRSSSFTRGMVPGLYLSREKKRIIYRR